MALKYIALISFFFNHPYPIKLKMNISSTSHKFKNNQEKRGFTCQQQPLCDSKGLHIVILTSQGFHDSIIKLQDT